MAFTARWAWEEEESEEETFDQVEELLVPAGQLLPDFEEDSEEEEVVRYR